MLNGTILGHYTILEELGVGGMGAVYRAQDNRLGRDVALKVILPGQVDATLRRRFLNEAKAASALNHPNTVTVYEAATVEDTDFIAMEFLAGETLSARIKRGALSSPEALFIAFQIAEGLNAAHAAGLVHRDLKPSNVMILPDGRVKILDFGLALRTEDAVEAVTGEVGQLTRSGVVVGTLAYMSPEQARGDAAGPLSDMFSLGVLVYEMLTGKHPFAGKSQLDVYHQICFEEPAPLTSRRAALPSAVPEIIARMMAKKPADRYPSMSAVVELLRPLALGSAPPKSRAWMWAAAALATVGLAAAAWLFLPKPAAIQRMIPMSASEHVVRGQAYLARREQKGNIENATTEFEAALSQDGENAAAFAGLADARIAKYIESPDAALLALAGDSARRAVKLNPDLAIAHASLGSYLSRAEKLPDAAVELQKAETLDPRNAQIQWQLGNLLHKMKQDAAAEVHFKKAIDVAPQSWETHENYGVFLFSKDRCAQAVPYFLKATQLAPDNYAAFRNLGACYFQLGRNDEAISAQQRSLEIRPMASGYSNLATIYYYEGRFTESAETLQKAVDMGTTDPRIWANLGDAWHWVPGGREKSTQAYNTADELFRALEAKGRLTTDGRATLARVLAFSGRQEDCKAVLKRLQTAPPVTSTGLYNMGLAYELTGNREAALSVLKRAFSAGLSRADVEIEPALLDLRRDARFRQIPAQH